MKQSIARFRAGHARRNRLLRTILDISCGYLPPNALAKCANKRVTACWGTDYKGCPLFPSKKRKELHKGLQG